MIIITGKVLSAELLKVEEEFPYFISMAALEYKEGIYKKYYI